MSYHWTLTTLREKLIKIGAKVVRHARRLMTMMRPVLLRERIVHNNERIVQDKIPSAVMIAAVVESVFAAKMSRAVNNVNVLCMG